MTQAATDARNNQQVAPSRNHDPFNFRRGEMTVTKEWKILQIVPAQPGWKAVFCGESENKQVKISNRVIICWALVEAVGANEAPRTDVRGVVQVSNRLTIVGNSTGTDGMTEDDSIGEQYFIGYNDPDAHKESDHWIDQARARLKLEHGKIAEQKD